jgi:hypothetical protein
MTRKNPAQWWSLERKSMPTNRHEIQSLPDERWRKGYLAVRLMPQ